MPNSRDASSKTSRVHHFEAEKEEADITDTRAIQSVDASQTMDVSTIWTEAAVQHFMQNFAPHSFFYYLPELYSTLPKCDRDSLDFIISVPALASLSQDLRQPGLLHLAYVRHASALFYTQKALSSTDLVNRDATLLSVLLLGLFEALIFRGRQNPANWTMHMQGSAALLNMRGRAQFDGALGRCLFIHSSGIIRANCALRGIPAPACLASLSTHATRIVSADHLAIRLGVALDAFAALRADTKTLSTTQHARKTHELGKELDSLLEEMKDSVPYRRLDGTASTLERVSGYQCRADWYPSQHAARRWNDLRMFRLFVAEHFFDALAATDSSELGSLDSDKRDFLGIPLPRLAEENALRAEKAIAGILYSLPYFIELFSRSGSTASRALIMPLSAIAASKLAPLSAKLFARDRLNHFGMQYELVQARQSAEMVKERSDLEDW